MIEDKHKTRILLRAPNWIGDAVMCLPALEALKGLYTDSDITVLTKKWAAPVFEGNPGVSDIMEFDDSGSHRGPRGRIRLIRDLRSKGFDLAVLFQNSFEAALIALLSGIPERAGYSRNLRGPLLTRPIIFSDEIKGRHHIFYYLNIIKELGKDLPGAPAPRIYIGEEEVSRAKNLIEDSGCSEGDFLIGAFPGASYGPAKRWSPEGFGEVLERFSEEHSAVPVIFGGSDDKEAAGRVEENIKGRHLNLTGKLSLREFMALATRLSLFITNDSGPMHVAAALGVPTLAVFGSTDPNLTGPVGSSVRVIYEKKDCSPCFERVCPYGHYECLTAISPGDVFSTARELFTKEKDQSGLSHKEGSPADTGKNSPAVFLDRDGTINVDTGYIGSPDGLTILNGAGKAIKKLNDAGVKVMVISNQSGVGRGLFSKEDVEAVNGKLRELLSLDGARLDGIYYCPHLPDEGCGCRKPEPGLVKRALSEHPVDLERSYVIGDKASDIRLAERVKLKGVLVRTGMGEDALKELEKSPDFVAKDLFTAVLWVMEDIKRVKQPV